MPTRALKPCRHPTCPRLTKDGWCEEHRPRRRDERPSAARRGYDYSWKKTRKRFLKENPECEICGEQATEVHHIIPLREGGGNEWENLMALCARCHRRLEKKKTGW